LCGHAFAFGKWTPYKVYLKKRASNVEHVDLIASLWPIFVGFITLVIVLGKIHADVDVLKEKVRTLFELWNKRND
jgi:hypothetical protein